MSDLPNPEASVEIFCSYSHARQDEALRAAFTKSMSPWVRKKVVQIWHDGRNLAGDNWAPNIDEHLNSADIVVLLVSPDFLSSDFCCDKEMVRALERMQRKEALVVPIIVRPSNWKETRLSDIQVLPDKAKPVTLWPHRDLAWQNVAESLAASAREVLTRKLKILQDREEAAKIYAEIARDAAAHAEERQRIMADLQSKIFALNEELGPAIPSVAKKRANDAFKKMDDYIRGDQANPKVSCVIRSLPPSAVTET